MSQSVAFLRAINVGGHTVKMTELTRLFRKMGFTDVATFIASGNVLFRAEKGSPPQHESTIAAALEEALGYAVATFVRKPAQLQKVLAAQPFGAVTLDGKEHVLYVGFLAAAPSSAAVKSVRMLSTPSDQFEVIDREVYWLRHRSGRERFVSPPLEKKLGQPTTLRNLNTIARLVTLLTAVPKAFQE
jgi:uncharacterized protein (DUF1697 family)